MPCSCVAFPSSSTMALPLPPKVEGSDLLQPVRRRIVGAAVVRRRRRLVRATTLQAAARRWAATERVRGLRRRRAAICGRAPAEGSTPNVSESRLRMLSQWRHALNSSVMRCGFEQWRYRRSEQSGFGDAIRARRFLVRRRFRRPSRNEAAAAEAAAVVVARMWRGSAQRTRLRFCGRIEQRWRQRRKRGGRQRKRGGGSGSGQRGAAVRRSSHVPPPTPELPRGALSCPSQHLAAQIAWWRGSPSVGRLCTAVQRRYGRGRRRTGVNHILQRSYALSTRQRPAERRQRERELQQRRLCG